MVSATPPSEPDGRISRIRLSRQWFLSEINRLAAAASESKPIALLGEIVLEDRFEHRLQRRFGRPVTHRRYAQRSLLGRIGLRYPNPARRLPVMAFIPPFFAQLGYVSALFRRTSAGVLAGLEHGQVGNARLPVRIPTV